MRKLIMWNLVTLDGYFEGEKAWDLGFHQLAFNEELRDYTIKQLETADGIIYGEKTYLGMADYWTNPAQANDKMTELLNKIPKYVCSSSLADPAWQNTKVIKDATTGIPDLLRSGEGNLFVFGSAILSETLIKGGFFDEYRLCVVPVMLGSGRRLFSDGLPYQKLNLLEAQPLKSGAIILRYSTT